MKKFLVAVTPFVGAVSAFAEGETSGSLDLSTPANAGTALAGAFTPWISGALTGIGLILAAGVAIVGVYYLWGVIKRAFKKSA